MSRKTIAIIFLSASLLACSASKKDIHSPKYQTRLEEFIDMRFGMFICYNIMSYGAQWGEANYPIESFNPQKLDCSQWADAAVDAGMTFGLLTTKHHEGFCLWDSEYTDYDVGSTPYKKDIVKQYVDAFRAKGLEPALYYSIWDSSNEIEPGKIDDKAMEFIKGQLTELLTNYGPIKYLVFDGWFWKFGHHEIPFIEIREHVRKLQPDCLITDHTHLQSTFHVDIPYFEGPFDAFPSEDNTMPSALGHCSVKGNGWFWSEATPDGLNKGESAQTITDKLTALESRYCNFMLNCMPNRDGLMDTLYLDLLAEIGELWQPDMNRPTLPEQDPPVLYELVPVGASAENGNPLFVIDSRQVDGTQYSDWIGGPEKPQSLTLDLGQVYDGLELITITPKHRCKPAPETSLTDGNIKHCKIYVSEDNQKFELVTEQQWLADGTMRTIEFEASKARYLKIEILDFEGANPVITEIAIGAYSSPPEAV